MAGESLHPAFLVALRVLAAAGVANADAWRMLRPLAERLGAPRPSYPTVRRVMLAERRTQAEQRERLERFLADMLRGLVPRMRDLDP